MLSRLVQFRSSLLQSKTISKRWRCASSSDPTSFHNQINQTSADSVFMVADHGYGDDGYYMIDKKENTGVLFQKSWLDEYDVDSKFNGCSTEIFEYDPETNLCQTHFKTSKSKPQVVPFVNNLADSRTSGV